MEVDSFIYSNTIFPLTACLNLTVGNIAQKQKELHSELKHTLLTNKGGGPSYVIEYMKKIFEQIPGNLQKQNSFLGHT